ncbi:hypothetical protein [Sulfobacillus thermosulfidooxidans]|uniref:hypothetical protein n=1 Tax=Sulfobacillus thermosulfidooxidans TaxID=28034 RepID=UPI00096B8A47|nr:hypothetical protein [Sulfobacillus thermosulfidooxidans]OLZ10538.1 hypothetical protein BFX05_01525 [Sulfobacillus thermosulfidooxidans]OLZ15226.1 hypothetical protein BFX06_04620 [Sulfobacillus thermosulfidooxidans]OLZ22215.1 hypothetical protein BFX07_10140 [Sulfobacillus thermosulfidooxidans]
MAVNKVANENETPKPIELTPEQWQGLARLGELIQAVDQGLKTGLGSALTENVLTLSQTLPSDLPQSLKAAAETLTTLHRSGLLQQLEMLLQLASQVPEFWQEVVPEKLLNVAEDVSQVDFKGVLSLGEEASKTRALSAMIALLRYVTQEAPQDFLGQVTEFVNQTAPILNNPDLLKVLPVYIDLLVQLQKSGLLDRVMDVVTYYQGLAPLLNLGPVIQSVLEYLNSSNLVENVKQIRPDNLALLAAEASDPDTTAVLADALRLARLLRNSDITAEFTSDFIKISGIIFDREFLDTLPDLLDTAVLLRKTGLLKSLQRVLVAYPNLAALPWNDYIASAVNTANKFDIADILKKVKEASQEAETKSAHLGGLGGLMRLMKDKEVQKLMQFAVSLGSKFLPTK